MLPHSYWSLSGILLPSCLQIYVESRHSIAGADNVSQIISKYILIDDKVGRRILFQDRLELRLIGMKKLR